MLINSTISDKKVTPFIMIGNRYIFDQRIYDSLPVVENNIYISVYFEKAFLFREDILYLPCLLRSYNYQLHLSDYYNLMNFKISYETFKSQLRTLYACKIPASMFLEFIDESVILNFCKEYTEAILHLYSKYKTVEDYEYLAKAFIVSEYISFQKLKYDKDIVKISFNPFTEYGRYGLNANSFNILSLARDKRHNLVADKDFKFYEFDFNAFEIRVLFALININQPAGDLYEVLHNMSDDFRARPQFKQFLISSIYSKNEHKTVLFKFLKAKGFYQRYKLVNNKVTNIFGKTMESDDYHLMSRVLQSSAAYILYQQMYKVICYLESNKCKSKVSFCIHDSICLSIHKDEIHILNDIKNEISSVTIKELNYTSNFDVKIKSGENYGDMKVYEA